MTPTAWIRHAMRALEAHGQSGHREHVPQDVYMQEKLDLNRKVGRLMQVRGDKCHPFTCPDAPNAWKAETETDFEAFVADWQPHSKESHNAGR